MTPAKFAAKYRVKGVKFDPRTGKFVKFTGLPELGEKLKDPIGRIRLECPNLQLLKFVVSLLPFTQCVFQYGMTSFQWSEVDGYAFYWTRDREGNDIFGDICLAENIPVIRTEDETHNSYMYMGHESGDFFDGDYREDDNRRDDDRARYRP